jgi:hypothetical protein
VCGAGVVGEERSGGGEGGRGEGGRGMGGRGGGGGWKGPKRLVVLASDGCMNVVKVFYFIFLGSLSSRRMGV